MAQSDFRLGIVGVGRMGANMARRLQELHYPVVSVYDTDVPRAQALAQELGCAAAPTLVGLVEPANTVLTVVSNDEAMRRIYAPGSADSLLRQATGRLFINCATLSPALQREVHTLVEQQGGQCLEACMASSITQARQGTLYLMCGGRPDVFERARPLLNALSAHLRYIGPAGEAAEVKALVNMVMNANTAALAEDWDWDLLWAWTSPCSAKYFLKPAPTPACWKPTVRTCSIVRTSAIFLPPMPRKTQESPVPWPNRSDWTSRWPRPRMSNIGDWSRSARERWTSRPWRN